VHLNCSKYLQAKISLFITEFYLQTWRSQCMQKSLNETSSFCLIPYAYVKGNIPPQSQNLNAHPRHTGSKSVIQTSHFGWSFPPQRIKMSHNNASVRKERLRVKQKTQINDFGHQGRWLFRLVIQEGGNVFQEVRPFNATLKKPPWKEKFAGVRRSTLAPLRRSFDFFWTQPLR